MRHIAGVSIGKIAYSLAPLSAKDLRVFDVALSNEWVLSALITTDLQARRNMRQMACVSTSHLALRGACLACYSTERLMAPVF